MDFQIVNGMNVFFASKRLENSFKNNKTTEFLKSSISDKIFAKSKNIKQNWARLGK